MSVRVTTYVVTPYLERTRAFYQTGLGVAAGERSGNWVPFQFGEATFALHATLGAAADEIRRASYSFSVDEIEAVVKRFQAQGARILRGIADETFGRMATLEDPDGRSFEVVHYG